MKNILTILTFLSLTGFASASNEFICKDLTYKEGKGGYLKESSMYKVESESRMNSFYTSNEINGVIVESYCSRDWSEEINNISLLEIFKSDKNKIQKRLDAHKNLEDERTETTIIQY